MVSFAASFRALAIAALCAGALAAQGCGTLPFAERPAAGYVYGSDARLRVAVVDETGGDGAWSSAIERASWRYAVTASRLDFGATPTSAHIVVRVRRYDDRQPPLLAGYTFQPDVGGFAAVYDAEGRACNFPPSPLPRNCSGEIARADIYVNDAIPPGRDIEARRERLILHELGHAMGLTRHSADLDIDALARRYGW